MIETTHCMVVYTLIPNSFSTRCTTVSTSRTTNQSKQWVDGSWVSACWPITHHYFISPASHNKI